MQLPQANAGSGAPEVDEGLTLLRFDDLVLKEHPDWATESDKFGKSDDGQRYHFVFTVLDESRQVVYGDDGDEINVEAVTRTATGAKSNFAAHMKGLLTPSEFALWSANQPFDGSVLPGRVVMGNIENNKSGWPQVAAVLPAPKAKKASSAVAAE